MSGAQNKGKSYTCRHYRRLARDRTLSELYEISDKIHERKKIKFLCDADSLQSCSNSHYSNNADEVVENFVLQDSSFAQIPLPLPSTSRGINTNDSIVLDKNCIEVQLSEKDIVDDFSYSFSDSEFSDDSENEHEESTNLYESQILYDVDESNNLLYETENLEECLGCNQSNQNDNNLKFKLDLRRWAIAFKIHLNAFSALQLILRKYTCIDFPKDARTFLKTPKCTNVSSMGNGQYCHLGLRNAVERILTKRCNRRCDKDEIRLLVCTDGAPIGHSSTKNLWPIMCCDTILRIVEVIGIYYGDGKPDDSNEFLEQFVNEAVYLINNGILYNKKHYKVRIHGIICDAPANRIIFEKINIRTKCNDKSRSDEKCSTKEIIKQSKASLIYDYFPLKDTNAVEEFENLLKNETFTVPQVAQTLLQRGGKKWEVFINNIMQDFFVDEVAVKYSYKGQGERKKNPFKNLLLKECVFKAAHLFSSNATDEGIKKQISTWLAGATLRLKRKTMKMEDKENKTDKHPTF